MKKLLSLVLSFAMVLTALFAVPAFAKESAKETKLSIPKIMSLNDKDYFEYQYNEKTKTLTIRGHGKVDYYEFLLPLVKTDNQNRENIMLTCDYTDPCIILALSDMVRSGKVQHVNTPDAHYDFTLSKWGNVLVATENFEADPLPYTFTYDVKTGDLLKIVSREGEGLTTYNYYYKKGKLSKIVIQSDSTETTTCTTNDKGQITGFTRSDSSGPGQSIQTYDYFPDGSPKEVTFHEVGIGVDENHRSQTRMFYNDKGQMNAFSFWERDSEGKYNSDWNMNITWQVI